MHLMNGIKKTQKPKYQCLSLFFSKIRYPRLKIVLKNYEWHGVTVCDRDGEKAVLKIVARIIIHVISFEGK